MKKTNLLLAVALMTTTASFALAAEAQKQVYTHTTTTQTQTQKPVVYEVKFKDMLSEADRAELQTEIEYNLKKLDVNGSKALERDEFVDKRMQAGASMTDANTEFMMLDTDKSGYVNSQEIMDSKMRVKAAQLLTDMVANTPYVSTSTTESVTTNTQDGTTSSTRETTILNNNTSAAVAIDVQPKSIVRTKTIITK